MGHIKDGTQEQRVLDELRKANGGWVDGMTFLSLQRPITQYHARIWGLQQDGFQIEGRFIEGKNWKEYRLVSEPKEDLLSCCGECYPSFHSGEGCENVQCGCHKTKKTSENEDPVKLCTNYPQKLQVTLFDLG